MKIYVNSASNDQNGVNSNKLTESDLYQYKYGVSYTCNNTTFGDDFLLRANEIGAIKVISTQLNPKTNRPFAGRSIFYAIKSLEDYNELKSIAKELGSFVKIGNVFDIHWDVHLTVSIDDYELGSYLVKKNNQGRKLL